MDAMEAIRTRRSCRAFSDRPATREELARIVDAGRLAPSGRNVQPWTMVVVTGEALRREIARLAPNGRFIADPGVSCIAVLAPADAKYGLEDCCAATATMLLMATSIGLESCWVAGHRKDYAASVAGLLGAPEGHMLASLIAVGHGAADASPPRPEKRPLGSVLRWESFDGEGDGLPGMGKDESLETEDEGPSGRGHPDPRMAGTLVTVADVAASRRFYVEALGQKVKFDFGENLAFESGLSIQERRHFREMVGLGEGQAAPGELYFESEDVEGVYARVAAWRPALRIVQRPLEHPWGQRVFRFLDPDGHLVEVGEPMEAVARRLASQGMALGDICRKSQLPMAEVRRILNL